MRASLMRVLIVAAAFAVIAAPTGGAEEPLADRGPKPEFERRTREQTLQMMVEDQQKEIARLRAENELLRKHVADLKLRELTFAPPALAPRPARPTAPNGAVPHEFNGETYYVIPLKTTDPARVPGEAVPAK